MVVNLEQPPSGPLRDAWRQGALAEAFCATEGMTKRSREVYEYVQVVARQGRPRDEVVSSTAHIFTAGWSFRKRLSLAWKILKK